MGPTELEEHLRGQAGVVSRRQVLAAGGTDADLERLLRRRDLTRVHPGVYVDHTGPLTWGQRAWAAVLAHAPAVLAGAAALRTWGLPGWCPDQAAIEVAVGPGRHLKPVTGVLVTRVSDFDAVGLHHLRPPRVRLEHAALTVASRTSTEDGAVAVLGDVCQRRRSTPDRLLEEIARRPRLPRRHLLVSVLDDVRRGANSALERRYLRDVERAHALPEGSRQVRVVLGERSAYHDVHYAGLGTVVELDGRLGHDGTADRWDDLDRDLDSATAGDLTVRVGWRQVLDPCWLADRLGRLLRSRGWPGAPQACDAGCRVRAA